MAMVKNSCLEAFSKLGIDLNKKSQSWKAFGAFFYHRVITQEAKIYCMRSCIFVYTPLVQFRCICIYNECSKSCAGAMHLSFLYSYMEAKNYNYHSILFLFYFYIFIKKMLPSEGHGATCARMVHHDADLVLILNCEVLQINF